MADAYLRQRGIQLHYLASSSFRRLFVSMIPLLRKRKQWRYDFVLFNSMASLYYVNVLGVFTGIGCMAAMLALRLKIPVLIYWHETEWVFQTLKKKNYRGMAMVDRVASNPSVIHLAASNACEKFINVRYPRSSPVTVYECASVPDYKNLQLPASPPLVVNLASVQQRKGTDLFVKTAIEVCRKHPTVKFLWIGDGKPYGTWMHDIEVSGFKDRIVFPGYSDNPYEILRNASMLFLSSRDDPFPLAVLEAMSLGRTVVTFNVGGAPEAIRDYGIVINPFDTSAAAGAILDLLRKPPGDLINYSLINRYNTFFTPGHYADRLNKIIRGYLTKPMG